MNLNIKEVKGKKVLFFFTGHSFILLSSGCVNSQVTENTHRRKRSYKWPEATEKMFRMSFSFLSSLCRLFVKLVIKTQDSGFLVYVYYNYIHLNNLHNIQLTNIYHNNYELFILNVMVSLRFISFSSDLKYN